ncbi:MAG TPA: [NiFe]-hydrogenase assembly chaperone HybE [Burkholderiales bacterium]|nr:[NiFe]-hydrogenase assembly chaperone HybE [Burkholderiales bacterium]
MEPAAEVAPRAWTESPAPALERAFGRIERERMRDVPILNGALRVEAVGFQPFQGHWIGILVTPWFLNALVLPGTGAAWPARGIGDAQVWALPIGACEFIAGHEEEIGEYHLCSLMSPVLQLEDQEAARSAARAALDTLLAPPAPKEEPAGPLKKLEENVGKPMSKREFLSGRVFRD